MAIQLSPAQQRAHDSLTGCLAVGNVVNFWGGAGTGKTEILRRVHASQGGALLTIREWVEAVRSHHPLALEETFYERVWDALQQHDLVIVDDAHLVSAVVSGCGTPYPRPGFLEAPVTALCAYAVEAGKKIVFSTEGYFSAAVQQRGYPAGIDDFGPADYEAFCGAYLPPQVAKRLDYAKVHRFAPNLNVHQVRAACLWLRDEADLGTERFIDYLRSQNLTSNVDLREVQKVRLEDLQGVDDVVESLIANVVVPLEHDELAAQLNLKPKRGVLLAGPPGTGKTTIGRALAHRLRGKFFLVDGTCISGTSQFYGRVHHIFEEAKQNAPSVIFIDDSDVIFEGGEEHGLYRYLLTMLDGLESEKVGQVCVLMTAMDVGNIPPALLRSGRIELWLEMHLPDADARLKLLRAHLNGSPDEIARVDLALLVDLTEGFTGADLKRVVADAKNLYAYDLVRQLPAKPAGSYFEAAILTLQDNRRRYAEAEAASRERRKQTSAMFSAGFSPQDWLRAYEAEEAFQAPG